MKNIFSSPLSKRKRMLHFLMSLSLIGILANPALAQHKKAVLSSSTNLMTYNFSATVNNPTVLNNSNTTDFSQTANQLGVQTSDLSGATLTPFYLSSTGITYNVGGGNAIRYTTTNGTQTNATAAFIQTSVGLASGQIFDPTASINLNIISSTSLGATNVGTKAYQIYYQYSNGTAPSAALSTEITNTGSSVADESSYGLGSSSSDVTSAFQVKNMVMSNASTSTAAFAPSNNNTVSIPGPGNYTSNLLTIQIRLWGTAPTSNTSKNWRLNYFSLTTPVAPHSPTSTVILDQTNIPQVNGNVPQGSHDVILNNFRVNSSTNPSILNGLSFTINNNFIINQDINQPGGLHLYTSSTPTFPGGTELTATYGYTAGSTSTTVNITGLSQTCQLGNQYFWITGDIYKGATVGDALSISSVTPTFAAAPPVSLTNNSTAGGTETITAGSAIPVINLDNVANTQVTAALLGLGTTNDTLFKARIVNTNNTNVAANLNSISFPTTGSGNTFKSTDITTYSLYASNSLSSTPTLVGSSTISGINAGTPLTFSGLSLNCQPSYTYLFVVGSVPNTASNSTIQLPNNPTLVFSNSSITTTTSGLSTAGLLSITAPSVTIGQTSLAQFAASTIYRSSTSNIISQFAATTAIVATTLNTFSFVAGGTFVSGDVTNFKLWAGTTSSFSAATTISTVSATALHTGSTVSFSSLTQSLPIGTVYFWITADISATATATNAGTSTIIVPATPTIALAAGAPTNNITAGGTQTILASTIAEDNTTITQIATGFLDQNATKQVISNFDVIVTNNAANLTSVAATITGTLTGNVTAFYLYSSTSSTFNRATATLLGTVTTISSPVTFSGLTATLPVGTTYLFIAADISASAVVNNTITVSTNPTLTFSYFPTVTSVSIAAGGTQTFTSNAFYWTSSVSNLWNYTALNFKYPNLSSSPTAWVDGSTVHFTSSASNKTVAIAGNVAPALASIEAAAYQFTTSGTSTYMFGTTTDSIGLNFPLTLSPITGSTLNFASKIGDNLAGKSLTITSNNLISNLGTTILSGSNSYTGGTSLSNATLYIGSNSALGTGAVTVSGNGYTKLGVALNSSSYTVPNTFVFSGTGTNTFVLPSNTSAQQSSYLGLSGVISGSAPITILGGQTINTLSGGTLNLLTYNNKGNNTYSGTITLGTTDSTQGAVLMVDTTTSLNNNNIIVYSHSQLQLANGSSKPYIYNTTGTMSLQGQAWSNLANHSTSGGAGALRVAGIAPTGTTTADSAAWNGGLTILDVAGDSLANTFLYITGSGCFNINGPITYYGAIQKQGGATLVLNGPATTLGTRSNIGTFINNNGIIVAKQSGIANNGVVTLTGANTFLVLNNPTQNIGSLTAVASSGAYIQLNGTALNVNQTGYSIFGSPSGSNTGATLKGTGSLSKTGGATLELQSPNTYSGGTTVTQGLLKLNNSTGNTLLSTSNVSVNGGNLEVVTNQTLSNVTLSSGSITVDAGATLTITGAFSMSGGTLIVNGTVIYQGTSYSVTGGTYNVTTNGTLNLASSTFNFPGLATLNSNLGNVTPKTLGSLTVSGSANITLTDSVKILTTFTPAGGTINFGNNYIVLRSTGYTASAIVAGITGTTYNYNGTGAFVVEKYFFFPTRNYHDLSPTVTNITNHDIFTDWQENGSFTISGYGIYITGQGVVNRGGTNQTPLSDATTGFDNTYTNDPSLWSYSNNGSNTSSWAAATSTIGNKLNVYKAMRVLTRGDRSWNIFTTPQYYSNVPGVVSTSTNLRATGKLLTTSLYYAPSAVGTTGVLSTDLSSSVDDGLKNVKDSFSFVTNPYQCPIDFHSIINNGTTANLYPEYLYFDPTLGNYDGYVIWNDASGTSSNPILSTTGATATGSNVSRYIMPGQAFFVKTSALNPVLKISESDKVTPAAGATLKRVFSSANPNRICLALEKQSTAGPFVNVDGAVAVFNPSFTSSIYSSEKLSTYSENLSIKAANKNFAIRAMQSVTPKDTLPLALSNLALNTNYQLQISTKDYVQGFAPYLVDRYKKSVIAVPLDSIYTLSFTVDSNSASYSNRFFVTFSPVVLPVSSIYLEAVKVNGKANLTWKTTGENNLASYSIEYSKDGINFANLSSVSPKNTSNALYASSAQLTTGSVSYYRIKATSTNNEVIYSNIATINTSDVAVGFTVYPNPLVGKTLTVGFNNIDKGNYTIALFNVLGQKVASAYFNHQGGISQKSFEIGSGLASGMYSISVLNEATQITVYQSNILKK